VQRVLHAVTGHYPSRSNPTRPAQSVWGLLEGPPGPFYTEVHEFMRVTVLNLTGFDITNDSTHRELSALLIQRGRASDED
jgi:hypothetical protein